MQPEKKRRKELRAALDTLDVQGAPQLLAHGVDSIEQLVSFIKFVLCNQAADQPQSPFFFLSMRSVSITTSIYHFEFVLRD